MYPNGCTTHIYLPMCIADNVVMENTNTNMLTLARAKPNKQRPSPEISVTKVEIAIKERLMYDHKVADIFS